MFSNPNSLIVEFGHLSLRTSCAFTVSLHEPKHLLDYSDHAEARCRARGVFRKQVQRTIRRPDRLYMRGHDSIAEYTTSSNALIRVVYRLLTAGNEHQVVSAIRLGKLKSAVQTATLGTLHDPLLDVTYIALY